MTISASTREFFQHRFEDVGICNAVIVDDAFDVPTASELQDNLEMFWNFVERQDHLIGELKNLGIYVASAEDFDDNAVATLWSMRHDKTPLMNMADANLFREKTQALYVVQKITTALEALGVYVTQIGNKSEDPIPLTSLVFLDYYLGPTEDPTAPHNAAVMARTIYRRARGAQKAPFFVLMSSKSGVCEKAQSFRENSELLAGLFDFASKEELGVPNILALKITAWAADMPIRHSIQHFVDTLDATVNDSARSFIQKAKALTMGDYAYVQSLSLEDEGHPLGDYVQWLFSSLLVNKILEENNTVASIRNTLNELSFEKPITNHGPATSHMAEVYSLTIAEKMLQDIDVHPRARLMEAEKCNGDAQTMSCDSDDAMGDLTPRQAELPFLRLGDLLVKDSESKVYMIGTPDCDLAFAPGTKRKLNPDQSVILIPGLLSPLRESKKQTGVQTDLFLYEEEQYRIQWQPKEVISVSVGEFFGWARERGYSRPARIRLPYAVKIQQEVTTSLSRLGMPVAPPLEEFVMVEYYRGGRYGQFDQMGRSVASGVTIIHRDTEKPSFVISWECLTELLDHVEDVARWYEAKRRDANATARQRLQRRIDRLKGCTRQPEILVPLFENTWELPKHKGKQDVLPEIVGLHRKLDLSGMCSDHDICLNIDYD